MQQLLLTLSFTVIASTLTSRITLESCVCADYDNIYAIFSNHKLSPFETTTIANSIVCLFAVITFTVDPIYGYSVL